MLIADWLAFWRRCEPQRQALFDVARQRSYSYAQLADAADLCALQLQSLGLQQGERIALLAANCPQTLMLLFACARLGVVLVPLNYRLRPAELSAWMMRRLRSRPGSLRRVSRNRRRCWRENFEALAAVEK